MHCYRHPEKPAVGICRACNKGLCRDCAAELNFGLACRNSCEERVTLLNRIVDTSAGSIAAANSNLRSASGFLMLMGGVMIGFSLYVHNSYDSDFLTVMLGAFGLLFALFGLVRLAASKYPSPLASHKS